MDERTRVDVAPVVHGIVDIVQKHRVWRGLAGLITMLFWHATATSLSVLACNRMEYFCVVQCWSWLYFAALEELAARVTKEAQLHTTRTNIWKLKIQTKGIIVKLRKRITVFILFN